MGMAIKSLTKTLTYRWRITSYTFCNLLDAVRRNASTVMFPSTKSVVRPLMASLAKAEERRRLLASNPVFSTATSKFATSSRCTNPTEKYQLRNLKTNNWAVKQKSELSESLIFQEMEKTCCSVVHSDIKVAFDYIYDKYKSFVKIVKSSIFLVLWWLIPNYGTVERDNSTDPSLKSSTKGDKSPWFHQKS